MRRFTALALALALLVLFASVVPSVLARETNADRFKRGYPPLPPTRRETAKRHQSSPILVTGVIEVRNNTGTKVLGFVENLEYDSPSRDPVIGVVDPNQPTSDRLQVQFSSGSGTVVANNVVFSPPLTEPSDMPFYLSSSGDNLSILTNKPAPLAVSNNPLAVHWSYNLQTQELTVFLDGSSTQVLLIWDQALNQLEMSPSVYHLDVQYVRFFLVPAT